MKLAWPSRPLVELCEFRNGLWKGKKPPYVHVGVIRNTNFTKSGFLDDSNIAYLDVEEKQFAKRQLRFGDLILEKSGGGPRQPVGRVITFEKTSGLFSFSNFTSVIRVLDPSVLSFRFLHRLLYWYYISGTTEGMQRRTTGIRNLDFNSYKQLQVPLPPIREQERIVAILDEAFGAIATATANAEKSLANARELFESELNRVFGAPASDWLPTELGEVADLLSGFAFKSKEYTEQGYFLVRIGNVQDGRLSKERPRFVQLDEKTHRYALESGDLLISLTGNIGRAARTEESDLPAALNQRVARLRLSDAERLDADFLYVFLRSAAFREGLANAGHGVAQQNVSPNTIKKLAIHLPDPRDQRRIANLLRSMEVSSDELQDIERKKLHLLAELRQSILHKVFTGELTGDAKAADRTLSEAGV